MNAFPTPQYDPRTQSGRAGAARFLTPGPDTLPARITIGLLYLAGVAVVIVQALVGSYIGAVYDYFLRALLALRVLTNSAASHPLPNVTPAVAVPGTMTPIIIGALIGGLVGLGFALPLFARAQMLSLQIRIEENTRQTKELLYYLLNKSN